MAAINSCDFDRLESSLHAEVNLGIERAITAWSLGKELEQLRAKDLQNNHRLVHVHARFNGMRLALGL